METRESYFERMRRMLDDLNTKISELEIKMDNAAKDFRDKYRPELDNLKALKKQVEVRLNDLKDPAKEAWFELRDGLDKAAVEINSALKRAFAKFNKPEGT